MTPIDSTWLDAHHYDPDARVLTVRYKNGDTYRHEDVPAEKVEAFTGAASPGSFYNSKIKSNHPGKKL